VSDGSSRATLILETTCAGRVSRTQDSDLYGPLSDESEQTLRLTMRTPDGKAIANRCRHYANLVVAAMEEQDAAASAVSALKPRRAALMAAACEDAAREKVSREAAGSSSAAPMSTQGAAASWAASGRAAVPARAYDKPAAAPRAAALPAMGMRQPPMLVSTQNTNEALGGVDV
jgi:hypothetical protein